VFLRHSEKTSFFFEIGFSVSVVGKRDAIAHGIFPKTRPMPLSLRVTAKPLPWGGMTCCLRQDGLPQHIVRAFQPASEYSADHKNPISF